MTRSKSAPKQELSKQTSSVAGRTRSARGADTGEKAQSDPSSNKRRVAGAKNRKRNLRDAEVEEIEDDSKEANNGNDAVEEDHDADPPAGSSSRKRPRTSSNHHAHSSNSSKPEPKAPHSRSPIHSDTFAFLRDLKAHDNDKPWFVDNSKRWDAVKSSFETFVESLKQRLIHSVNRDIPDAPAKSFIFRINRDVRFGGPLYKHSMSAAFPKKPPANHPACFYLHIQPDDSSYLAGGMWCPDAPALARIREEIDNDGGSGLDSVLSHPDFKAVFGHDPLTKEGALKTAPKGYAKDHVAVKYLKLKNFAVSHKLTDVDVMDEGFLDLLVGAYDVMFPLIALLNQYAGV